MQCSLEILVSSKQVLNLPSPHNMDAIDIISCTYIIFFRNSNSFSYFAYVSALRLFSIYHICVTACILYYVVWVDTFFLQNLGEMIGWGEIIDISYKYQRLLFIIIASSILLYLNYIDPNNQQLLSHSGVAII